MQIENKIVEVIKPADFLARRPIEISNSIIRVADFSNYNADSHVSFRNCIIYELLIHSSWFKHGLLFENNHVMSYVDYQMGGHNDYPIYFKRNIFSSFVNFFDCQFTSEIEISYNIFFKGTNIIGNQSEGFANTFEIYPFIHENIGALNCDGVGLD